MPGAGGRLNSRRVGFWGDTARRAEEEGRTLLFSIAVIGMVSKQRSLIFVSLLGIPSLVVFIHKSRVRRVC